MSDRLKRRGNKETAQLGLSHGVLGWEKRNDDEPECLSWMGKRDHMFEQRHKKSAVTFIQRQCLHNQVPMEALLIGHIFYTQKCDNLWFLKCSSKKEKYAEALSKEKNKFQCCAGNKNHNLSGQHTSVTGWNPCFVLFLFNEEHSVLDPDLSLCKDAIN